MVSFVSRSGVWMQNCIERDSFQWSTSSITLSYRISFSHLIITPCIWLWCMKSYTFTSVLSFLLEYYCNCIAARYNAFSQLGALNRAFDNITGSTPHFSKRYNMCWMFQLMKVAVVHLQFNPNLGITVSLVELKLYLAAGLGWCQSATVEVMFAEALSLINSGCSQRHIVLMMREYNCITCPYSLTLTLTDSEWLIVYIHECCPKHCLFKYHTSVFKEK